MVDEFMTIAIEEAKKGRSEGGIPIGSVLVKDGQINVRGHNKRVQDGDPVTHAEIDCLRNAGRVGNYRGTIIYSTLMPCYLCAGAVVQFGIKRLLPVKTKHSVVQKNSCNHMVLKSSMSIQKNARK